MSGSSEAYGVFEGGGVKGIALIGALKVTEERGYELTHVAGNSAGSIVASLVAAGYRANEIREIMDEFDLKLVMRPSGLACIPIIGIPLQLHFKMGLYEAKALERTLKKWLDRKGIRTFGDLRTKKKGALGYKLHVMSSNISRGKLVDLPTDLPGYGIDPDSFEVARAVRMSMSIPLLFVPRKLKGDVMVDGVLISNYPVWVFDTGPDPAVPTFGYRIMGSRDYRPKRIDNARDIIEASALTMIEANDQRYIDTHDFKRTIHMNTKGTGIAEFWIDKKQKEKLFKIGEKAAIKFFDNWDFQAYKDEFGESLEMSEKARKEQKRV